MLKNVLFIEKVFRIIKRVERALLIFTVFQANCDEIKLLRENN